MFRRLASGPVDVAVVPPRGRPDHPEGREDGREDHLGRGRGTTKSFAGWTFLPLLMTYKDTYSFTFVIVEVQAADVYKAILF